MQAEPVCVAPCFVDRLQVSTRCHFIMSVQCVTTYLQSCGPLSLLQLISWSCVGWGQAVRVAGLGTARIVEVSSAHAVDRYTIGGRCSPLV